MRRSLGIDPKRPFALQTLIAMHLHFMIHRIAQRFRDAPFAGETSVHYTQQSYIGWEP
jgi:hypothetical protein